MASINKILNKVNSATNAYKSLKGVQSKIEGFRDQAKTTVDQLEEQAAAAERTLEKRRLSLQKGLSSANVATRAAKRSPETTMVELQYPLHEDLDNQIIFSIRPRKARTGNGANLMSKEVTEISLYIPDGLVSTASVSYKSEGVGMVAREFLEQSGADGFVDSLEAGVDSVVNMVKTAMSKMMNAATGGLSDFVQGKAANPMQEQMLDGVQFRSFTFNYEFYPRSQAEADMVNMIIYKFRTAMLPDTFGAGEGTTVENYFNYPNIFDVFFDGPVASKLDGFLPMVCTKVDVDHFGGQKVATYADGQPIKTTVNLEFLEIKTLTQETYQHISPMASTADRQTVGSGQQSLLDNQSMENMAQAVPSKEPTVSGRNGG